MTHVITVRQKIKNFRSGQVLLLALVLLIGLSSVTFAQKRAFTLDDIYRIKGISGMSIAPDGQRLLFTVTQSDYKKGKSNSDLYLLDLKNGGAPKQLTHDLAGDFSPAWSLDGRVIYFISTRQDGAQLWQMDATGGEPFQVSHFYTGVSAPKLAKSSRGDCFYFTATVFSECMADNDCNERYQKKLDDGPVQAHVADSLLFRHWNAWRDWSYTHLFALDKKTGKVTAISQGKQDYPSFSLGGGDGYDISPDGLTLCIVANNEKKQESSTNSDLFLVDLKGDEFKPRIITADNKAYDGVPRFSPDGRYIAYTAQKIANYESDKKRLCLYDMKSAKTMSLTESLDNWVEEYSWSPDSRYLYFTLQEKGYLPLYRVNVSNGKIEKVLAGHSILAFQLTPDGKDVIFTRSAVGQPVEIWRYRMGNPGQKAGVEQLTRLTSFNQALADEVDIRPAESFWVKGAAGVDVHLFIVKPHGFEPTKKYPLILNIHGGPQMQWSDSYRADWQVYPGAGYIVAFANPHGSTGYGQEYTRAISNDWTGLVMEDIDKVSAYLAALPYVDSERMGAMGWSWGGYAIMWLEGHNKYFKALASMMGIYDTRCMFSGTEELWFSRYDLGGTPWDKTESYRDKSPSSYVKNFKTPCLIISGERDYRVPYNMSIEFFTDLQERDVPSRLILFKNDGHWPDNTKSMPVYYNAHLEWFNTYLQGDKAPYETEKMVRNLAYDKEDK